MGVQTEDITLKELITRFNDRFDVAGISSFEINCLWKTSDRVRANKAFHLDERDFTEERCDDMIEVLNRSTLPETEGELWKRLLEFAVGKREITDKGARCRYQG